jgi:putative aldouronate transport system permease protein
MLIPGVTLTIIFSYIPMLGIIMAFEKFIPVKSIFDQKWVGLGNFKYMIHLPDVFQILFNTVFIASMKIVALIAAPVILALLLNEVGKDFFKRTVQTLVYLPHFISWVILSAIFLDILSPSTGIVNQIIKAFGLHPIFFLGNEKYFPFVMVATNVWRDCGFEAIIYLAALTSIDPTHYESAIVDGAGRWRQTWNITLPGIMPIIILMTVLSLGSILNAGFDQIFNMLSPVVYRTGDIIDTFVYRLGMKDAQYSVATAVGLFKSVVSFAFLTISYRLAYKYSDYRIF